MKKNTQITQITSVEKMGLIPRSILRTFGRFRLQLWPGIERLVIQEFKISRYQFLVSIKSLVFLVFVPLFFNSFGKQFLFKPIISYYWNTQQSTIFLNASQEKHAFHQIEDYEEKLYFESLIMPPLKTIDTQSETSLNQEYYFEHKIQEKYIDLANEYNEESIDALSNLFTDFLTLLSFWFLSVLMKPQLMILKSFLTEFLYSFGDTTKSFLLLFITDLFVGFHSPHGWEVFLETTMEHFGFAENEDFIFLFVATFPVLLDTVIKYWIFRYLNRLSPSTVATYHTMIE
uniref:envelope membrane protein n=1 Tax=Tetraselmis marina TaxID=41888 RepID=UPI0021ABAE89|nr:envelope membrane protein [Tetraselmis marina]UUA64540.1 envelope membrane protein [Tetraselmis marina]